MYKQGNKEDTDVLPVNGSARFKFTFDMLSHISLPNWPPEGAARFGWNEATAEIKRHWPNISSKNIWAPYPILSYCVGAAEGPVDVSNLSEIERTIRKTLHDGKNHDSKIHVRFFLFPAADPVCQDQAIAQVIVETITGATQGDVRMWVDALRENELSGDNISDIEYAIKQYG